MMRYILGVDVGGTNTLAAAVPDDGVALVGLRKERTDKTGAGEGIIAQIARLARAVKADLREETGSGGPELAGIGIGAPGPLDRAAGVVLLTPNLGWRDFPLRDRVGEATGLPTALDNDANCATLGEWWRGAARGAQHVIGLTIGTGIGGGIVLDGTLYHGTRDMAGEFGHMSIDSTGRRCNCGNYGCLEAYASGTAIAARAIEGIQAGADTILPNLANGTLEGITAQLVYDAAHQGDEYALEVIKDTARFLGTGVASLINVFNPDVVVICGGVTAAGDRLFGPLRSEVKRRAFRPAVDACRIVPGELAGTAGVYGAAASFKHQTWGAV
jgi:glucokinase